MNRKCAKAQFERLCRAFEKMSENRNRELVEYEDDVWCFFQNCWHLKDWIKNDDQISKRSRDSVETDANRSESLRICADLANRSKHLKLKPLSTRHNRHDADVSKRNVTIHPGPPGEGFGEYNFVVLLEDGREKDAIAVGEDAINEWRRLLGSYGVAVGSQP